MEQRRIIILTASCALILGLIIGAVFSYRQDQASIKAEYNSFFVDASLVELMIDGAPACLKNQANRPTIVGGIVNHHLLAGKLIKEFFCQVASSRIKRVIILAPNHFGLGNGQSISGVNDWQTSQGLLAVDKPAINYLKKNETIAIDDGVFIKEHGIGNLMPLIKIYFPQAKIIPLVIKERISAVNQEKLVQGLQTLTNEKTLVIASLDFSHDLSLTAAEIKDAQTLPILQTASYGRIGELNQISPAANVDSLSVLSIFLRLMAQEQATEFTMLGHSNSALVSGQSDLASTTSYFTAVYSRNK